MISIYYANLFPYYIICNITRSYVTVYVHTIGLHKLINPLYMVKTAFTLECFLTYDDIIIRCFLAYDDIIIRHDWMDIVKTIIRV